jgi:Mrp family chromosome partitioning ATPase
MAKLAATGQQDSALYRELQQAVRQLDAAEAVQGSAAILVQPAVSVAQVQPRTTRNVVLGVLLGVVLGVGIAFLVDRLDTRVRSPEQAEAVVGLPVLGELPRPPTLPARGRTISMVEFPYGPYAEGVRKLRSNVEFANVEAGARTIMVTSALGGEGKTTSASDLAVALARSGKKVALCDLDSRAPTIDRAFALGGARGLVEVVFGIETLERALVTIELAMPTRSQATPIGIRDRPRRAQADPIEGEDEAGSVSTTTGSPRGHLHVLPFGRRKPPNPGDFVSSSAVRQLIADVADTHDIVIVDTPPMVPVSDALAISEYVDAALIVCSLGTTRKPLLRTVRKLVGAFPARVLGLVVTGVPETAGYGDYYVPAPSAEAAVAATDARRASVRVES